MPVIREQLSRTGIWIDLDWSKQSASRVIENSCRQTAWSASWKLLQVTETVRRRPSMTIPGSRPWSTPKHRLTHAAAPYVQKISVTYYPTFLQRDATCSAVMPWQVVCLSVTLSARLSVCLWRWGTIESYLRA